LTGTVLDVVHVDYLTTYLHEVSEFAQAFGQAAKKFDKILVDGRAYDPEFGLDGVQPMRLCPFQGTLAKQPDLGDLAARATEE
jgi:hypothetical protein